MKKNIYLPNVYFFFSTLLCRFNCLTKSFLYSKSLPPFFVILKK